MIHLEFQEQLIPVKVDDVTVIDHKGGELMVTNCMFRQDSPKATLYKGAKRKLCGEITLLRRI